MNASPPTPSQQQEDSWHSSGSLDSVSISLSMAPADPRDFKRSSQSQPYTYNMRQRLPSYSKDHPLHSSLLPFLASSLQTVLKDRRTRNVFFYLLLNLSFMLVEIVYGWLSNSLGLIGDGVHMLFDSTAILLSLGASVVAQWEPNPHFTYGYGRVELLAGFLNGVALFFAAASITMEALERLLDPPHIKTDQLLLVSVVGLLVNLVGIFAFDHGGMGHSHHDHSHGDHSHHDHSHGDCGHDHSHHDHSHHDHSHHDHGNHLLDGMFLHILADTMGSVGVIVSTLLIQNFGWTLSDPICSLFLAALIFASIWPLLKKTGYGLLQRTPLHVDPLLHPLLLRIKAVPGVIAVAEYHFWEQASGVLVATVRVIVAGPNEDAVIRLNIKQLIQQSIGEVRWLTVEVERDVTLSSTPFY